VLTLKDDPCTGADQSPEGPCVQVSPGSQNIEKLQLPADSEAIVLGQLLLPIHSVLRTHSRESVLFFKVNGMHLTFSQ
jgi:hypothetical protein